MGRFGGKYGHHSTPFILDSMSKYRFWKYIGVFGIFTNLAVAAYYCYLESWTLGYIWHSVAGTFNGQTRDEVANFFTNYTSLTDAQPIVFKTDCPALCPMVNGPERKQREMHTPKPILRRDAVAPDCQ